MMESFWAKNIAVELKAAENRKAAVRLEEKRKLQAQNAAVKVQAKSTKVTAPKEEKKETKKEEEKPQLKPKKQGN